MQLDKLEPETEPQPKISLHGEAILTGVGTDTTFWTY